VTPPAWLSRQPIAHRGLHDGDAGVPENSRAAFEAAIAAGYAIELDLQRSADGAAMVFHDGDLDRMTEESGPVTARAAAELGRIRLSGSTETIPTLAQVLDDVAGRAPILVEIKSWHRPVGGLEAAALSHLQDYDGAVAVQSFDPASLAWFRHHAPGIRRGQIGHRYRHLRHGRSAWQRFLLRNLLLSGQSRPHFIAYDIDDLPHPAPALARRLGLPLLAWTVRSEAAWEKARGLADNVIFEQIRP
jgi:glycerophosphoryl diester phosphodiesterase